MRHDMGGQPADLVQRKLRASQDEVDLAANRTRLAGMRPR